MRNRFRWITMAMTLVAAGCAHRRESFYPNSRGVHVEAPFVNVHVPAGPGVHVDATGALSEREVRRARRPSEPPLLMEEDE